MICSKENRFTSEVSIDENRDFHAE